MSICNQCNKVIQKGELLTGWDNYDDIPYPEPFLYTGENQPEIRFGSDIRHINCKGINHE